MERRDKEIVVLRETFKWHLNKRNNFVTHRDTL